MFKIKAKALNRTIVGAVYLYVSVALIQFTLENNSIPAGEPAGKINAMVQQIVTK